MSDTAFGKEDCAEAANTQISAELYQGGVPVRDLNLPFTYATDGYNNRINYLVSSGMTVAATYTITPDAIEMRTGQLDDDCTDGADPCQVMGAAAYLLLSNGLDHRGAYTARGSMGHDCIRSPTTTFDQRIDSKNCIYTGGTLGVAGIPDNAFYDSRYNAGTQELNYFDDVIVWHSKNEL